MPSEETISLIEVSQGPGTSTIRPAGVVSTPGLGPPGIPTLRREARISHRNGVCRPAPMRSPLATFVPGAE